MPLRCSRWAWTPRAWPAHADAAKALYAVVRNKRRGRASLAMDASSVSRRSEMFPNANRLLDRIG